MTRTLALVFCLLLPELAAAQVAGVCGSGRNCSFASAKATAAANINGTGICLPVYAGSYSIGLGSTAVVNDFAIKVYSGTTCSGAAIQTPLNYAVVTGVFKLGQDGSAANPSLAWLSDPDTGFSRPTADQVLLSTGGVSSLLFRLTGYISEPSLNSNLVLSSTAATLNTGTSTVAAGSSNVNLNPGSGYIDAAGPMRNQTASAGVTVDDPQGFQITGVAATALSATPRSLQADSTTGRAYWSQSASVGSAPPVDLGGGSHPVLQQKTWIIEVDQGGAAAMTWDVAPRYAGATLTIATVDGAAAGFATGGTGGGITPPYIWHLRTLNTTAVANNTSTMTSSAAFVQSIYDAPRFCQRVFVGATQTSRREWIGLMSALPGSTDLPAVDMMAFRFSTAAGDTAWMYCVGDSIGATKSCTTTGVTPTTNAPDLLCVDGREGSAVTFWVNGVAKARVTSGLPVAGGSVMKPVNHHETLAASARALSVGRISIETN